MIGVGLATERFWVSRIGGHADAFPPLDGCSAVSAAESSSRLRVWERLRRCHSYCSGQRGSGPVLPVGIHPGPQHPKREDTMNKKLIAADGGARRIAAAVLIGAAAVGSDVAIATRASASAGGSHSHFTP